MRASVVLSVCAGLTLAGCGGSARDRATPDGADTAMENDAGAMRDAPPDKVSRLRCASSGGVFGDPESPWENPVVRCAWLQTGHSVYSSPLVIDLTGDGLPEIVFLSKAWDGGAFLHAISGADCTDLWVADSKIEATAELAAGDLDGDGKPEIVGHGLREFGPGTPPMGKPSPSGPGGGEPWEGLYVLHAYNARGEHLGASEPLPNGPYIASGAAIVDIDNSPPAEIVFSAGAYRLDVPNRRINTLWDKEARMAEPGILSVAADVDLDGAIDVVTGNRIYSAQSAADLTPALALKLPPGFAAIAQVDESSPEPEIVIASSPLGRPGSIGAYNALTGKIVFGPMAIPNKNTAEASAGPPAVADFDGDQRPEFGVAGPDDYRVFDPDCTGSPLPVGCSGPGLRWSSRTLLQGTGTPSSTAFDFNGDCRPEVVYRDTCWLRIYDGATGTVRAVASIGGSPHLEQPVVADVDGDGHAEIVVSSSEVLGCSGPEEYTRTPRTERIPGVYVLADPDARWISARRIWNQHGYHITNIDESGAVPSQEVPSWDRYNSYRQNVPRP